MADTNLTGQSATTAVSAVKGEHTTNGEGVTGVSGGSSGEGRGVEGWATGSEGVVGISATGSRGRRIL